jgi:hypothetical protein
MIVRDGLAIAVPGALIGAPSQLRLCNVQCARQYCAVDSVTTSSTSRSTSHSASARNWTGLVPTFSRSKCPSPSASTSARLDGGHFLVHVDSCDPVDVSVFDIAVVVLVARSNRLEDLRPIAPRILEVLDTAARGRVTVVSA